MATDVQRAPGGAPRDPKVLFVISGSYGDLSAAITFVYGQQWAGAAAVALPNSLYRLNHGHLTVQTYRYETVQDILSAARVWEARVVIFLSAYGFPIERLTSPSGVRDLVLRLRDQGRCVATTDPFLGSAPSIVAADIREMLPSGPGWLFKPLLGRVARRVARVLHETSEVLRDVTHLYPVPVDGIVDNAPIRSVSFFNPETTRRHREWEPPAGHGEAPGLAPPTWLFVLAPSDLFIQQRRGGTRRFVGRLVNMFRQTHEAGRRPVIVGPPSLLKLLARPRARPSEAELVPFSSYPAFETRLLDAEYAFYWNAFSCSATLVRMVKKLPVFFFDQGHVARFSRRIFEDGVQGYFGGWQPSTLPEEHLEPAALEALAAAQTGKVEELIRYWSRSPDPRQAVDLLLGTVPG